jgi:TusA-related sulfurtransferase
LSFGFGLPTRSIKKINNFRVPLDTWEPIQEKEATGEKPMSELLPAAPQSANTVDARGSACPGPLLEAKKAIATVKMGDVLEILSNDPGTKDDIPKWAGKVGHKYVGHMIADGYDRIFVRRGK